MKEHVDNAVQWLKDRKFRGCITGSCLLDYFEGQDVDFFAYSESAFLEVFYALWHDPKFQILDELELWKAKKLITNDKAFHKKGFVTTIKFHYNTCVPVNIILKKDCPNIFSVLSTFDLDIICKGYDTFFQKELDLTGDSTVTHIASWNTWNPAYHSEETWDISRILRQCERCVKYHNRGFNTDAVVLKYIELIDKLQKYHNVFSSEVFTEKLKIMKANTKVVKQICQVWLKTHEITDEQLEIIRQKVNEI